MKTNDLVIVDVPSPYANMSLNGSLGKVVHIGEMITTVKLVTGSHLGVEWQFNPAHIRLANKSMHWTLGHKLCDVQRYQARASDTNR